MPFEKGRRDAAPKGDDGAGAGGAGSGGGASDGEGSAGTGDPGGSLFRTENNFGSSSRVPGTVGAASAATAAEQAIADSLAASSDAGDPSTARSYGLLLLIALAGAGIGVAMRRQHTA